MNDDEDIKDVLKMLIQEHYTQVRHYETQRSTVSNLIVFVAAAILAFVTYDKDLTLIDLPLTILLILIGLFGSIFCFKFYERARRNYERLRHYRAKLDEILFESGLISNLVKESNRQHTRWIIKDTKRTLNQLKIYNLLNKTNLRKRLFKIKVHKLWAYFHFAISIIGLFLTVLAIFLH